MKRKKEHLEERIAKAEKFEVDPHFGLNAEQVKQRQSEGLVNKTKKHVTKSYAKIVFDNVFNFLNVLLFVVFIAMLFAKLPFTSYMFMVVLAANIIIGLIQDIHARHLVDKLRLVSNPKAKAMRGGEVMPISADEVVLGDILLLEAGDQVISDGTLVIGRCSVDESMLTGESESVEKEEGDSILAGTYLKKGRCYMKVEKIGKANYIETLQNAAAKVGQPKSEIKTSIGLIMTFCCVAAIVVGTIMTISWLVRSSQNGTLGDPQNYSTFIASLSGSMVAMLPAGMFLLTSLTLAVGVIQLSKRRMLVQQLYCIEMLARIDVLCLDKTGTLTDGSMAVESLKPLNGAQSAEVGHIIRNVLSFTGDNNSTALALKAKYGSESARICLAFIPFDSANKYSAATIVDEGTFCIGAYGFVPSKPSKEAEKIIEEAASKGHRCLVVARSDKPIERNVCPKNMEIIGVVVLTDHLKEDAKTNISWFQDNGVNVKIISGDDPITVYHIAERAGVKDAEKYVSLLGKSLEETEALASKYSVFGRVSPEQKAALIRAFQKQGHKVAMTGDGVNDILALRAADCSIAMASGADAAKNVSHLVSLDSDFSKLPDVVAQGRRVINNLQRTCALFLSKTLFALIVSSIFLFSFALGGKPYPFTTANMLPWETFAIGFAAFFLALQPSNERLQGSFLENILLRCIPAGITASIAGLLPFLFFFACPNFYSYELAWENATTLAVILFTFVSYVVLYRICWPPNKYRHFVFAGSSILCIVAFFLDFYLHGTRFSVIQLNWQGLTWGFPLLGALLALALGATYLGIDYIGDRLRGRRKKEKKDEDK